LFDETLIRNQDYELNIRLRQAGGTVWFDPALEVAYRPRPSWRALARQYVEYGAWKRHVLRMHPGSLKVRQVVPPITLLAIVASIVASAWLPITLVIPGLYVVAVVVAALATSWRDVIRLTAIFPTVHMSWAWGFLFGRRARS
ncbi:MAG: hypothetical protein RIS41_930, partial [Actinomycetota bacterium]